MSAASPLVIEDLQGPFVGPVSLRVDAGTCAVVAGASGAGKSLFLRMIADLVPSTGDVRLGDRRRAATPAPAWRRQVMYVGADAGWWDERVGAHFPSKVAAEADVAALGLPVDSLERRVASLSTGEKQRLALVRALARTPQVLLLDEPTSGLDPAGVGRVEDLLRQRIAAGLTAIVVSHDAAQAQRLGTRRYTMAAGRLDAV